MNIPKKTTPLLWGAAIGAALCAILGFTWGGWMTGKSARSNAEAASHSATVLALAPFCAERFRAQDNAAAKLAELAKASDWQRGSVVEKSGFATMAGNTIGETDIARACADLLLAPKTPKS
ncbi:hypothetical protein [Reyranella sp.]|uniref:hypothetical protein n=1 Tax=Reyranella sp. TaxID=1929291 RepID=UPI003BAD4B4B